MKKFQSIINSLSSLSGIVLVLLIWQLFSSFGIVKAFMLPSPLSVVNAFVKDFTLLMGHSKTTLVETFIGLSIGVTLGFIIALLMDKFNFVYKSVYPLLIITQTIPTIAIAPLLVLWFGYDMMPKIVLIILVTFFPIAIGVFDGLKSIDEDIIKLLKSMGASNLEILWHAKLPSILPQFFAALRISVSYSIVGAVIAEWLGGMSGLGVYMTRVRKSYALDRMFAVIFLISLISVLLMKLVDLIEKVYMPWINKKENK
ncbi:MAG: ABC transporter permease [Peptoniphilaceae bacterium]